MIGMFSFAGVLLAGGLFGVLVSMGATRRSRAPVHENGRSER